MQNFIIISDSSCDLPKSYLSEFSIDVVPYYVSFDTVNYYKENVDISVTEFYRQVVEEKKFPKTSLPPIQDYIDIFKKNLLNGLDILCICLSAKFSGSFQSAHNAKNILLEEFPDRRIEIIDSEQATAGQGLVIYEAALMQQKGYSLDEIIEKTEKLKLTAKINFTVDSLEHLQKGGRIGKASALAGTILNIKPIIVMKNGELMPVAKVRGRKKAINEILSMTIEEIGNEHEKYHICVLKAAKIDEAVELCEIMKANHNFKIISPIFDIGVTIGTHAGPTALGISYIKKFDCLT